MKGDKVVEVGQVFPNFSLFLNLREDIAARLKELGFVYITLDVEGFRSGSMDL